MDPKDVAQLVAKAQRLERGCDCEYDYRCYRCEQIIEVVQIADRVSAQIVALIERKRNPS